MIHGTNPTPSDARLDRLVAEVMAERAEDVYAAALSSREMTERIAGGPQFTWLRPGARLWASGSLAIVALVALLAAAALAVFVIGSRLGLQSTQLAVAGQVIDAVNSRDVGSLRSAFAADGMIEFPGVDARAGREGDVFVSDRLLHEDAEWWMRLVEPWGLEAGLGSCRTHGESTLSCDVVTRWHVLQLEIGEEWTFDFEGARVTRLQMVRVDPDPSNRVLPLGLGDLDRWEAWLREAHPEEAAGLLPTGPDPFGWWYFRYYGSPDEIGASIDEYLESRDPLVGTYVCSEDGNPDVTHLWDVRDDGTITRVSGETGEALPAGTWSRDNGRLLTNFEGGMTWFATQGDRLVIPGGWACTPGSSR